MSGRLSAYYLRASAIALFAAAAIPFPLLAQQVDEETRDAAAERGRTVLPPLVLNQAPGTVSGPGPVSSTDGEDVQLRFGGNPQEALRATPGTFTRQVSNQPGIEVNIRGLSGFGRVNAMIDGVPQTFRNVAGHASSGGSMLYVQPELLGGIDVVRGPVSGAAGAGTLAGAANFRTLSADDVLLEGRNSGILTRQTIGTNGYDYSGMVAGAMRGALRADGSGRFSIMAGFARSNFSNYERGSGDRPGDGEELPAGLNAANSPTGAILKVEIAPDSQHEFRLGWRGYDNEFDYGSYRQGLTNSTFTADYSYRSGHPLLNLDFSAYYNDTDMTYDGEIGGSYRGRETENLGYGFNLTNTARFSLGGASGTMVTGISYGADDYRVNALRGGNPPGELRRSSAFSEATLQSGIYTLNAGLRYDHWRMSGYQPPIAPGVGDCPPGGPTCGDATVNRSGGRVLPRLQLAAEPIQGLQFSAGYSHTFRPPTVQEMLFSLIPIGAGVGTGAANNLNLEPETARSWELGANLARDNVLSHGDALRLRVGYFSSRIDNFIVNDFVNVPGRGVTAMWVNRPGTTHMRGWEIEGSYDMRNAFVNASFTKARTDQPVGQGAGIGNGDSGILPDTYYTLGGGVRLFDERLTLGAQMRYVGEGQAAYFGSVQPTDSYRLYDLYASYDVTETIRAHFSVENVTNVAYSYAGSGMEARELRSGRGLTARLGFTARF